LIERADLVVVNETEAEFYGAALAKCKGWLATTFGAGGAELSKGGETIAKAKSPVIDAIDTTGAGDTFTAALTIALLDDMEAKAALEFACAAGAAAAMKQGAQPSLPFRKDVEALMDKL
jgi:ribokinase